MRRVRSVLPGAAPVMVTVTVILLGGCGAQKESGATLVQIVPASAYNDAPIHLTLLGGPFRPSVAIETYSGTANVGTAAFQVFLDPSPAPPGRRSTVADQAVWKGPGEIDAVIPAGLPAGDYSVGMLDPRGQAVPPAIMFRSLGPDLDAPRITFLEPPDGTAVFPGEWVTVIARVDDRGGRVNDVSWSEHSPSSSVEGTKCTLDEDLLCSFAFLSPATTAGGIESIEVRVEAADALRNRSSKILYVDVAQPPVLSTVSPGAGPTAGGTTITVDATNLVAGLSLIFVDEIPIGGVVSGSSIRALTRAHIPGTGTVTVRNGDSSSGPLGFEFVPPPNIRLIDPRHAFADPPPRIRIAGNDFAETTRFYWKESGEREFQHLFTSSRDVDAPAPAAIFLNSSLVQLNLLPGSGAISILAHDEISGDSAVVDAFTFDPAP